MAVSRALFYLFLTAASFGVGAEVERLHSQRYLSIYANDVTENFADYDQVKELMRKYILAWQARDKSGLKETTAAGLYVSLLANIKQPRGFSIRPEFVEIRDLAVYSYDKKTFVQFDVFDSSKKRSHSLKSWFVVGRAGKRWVVQSILDHFDPDARP